VIFDLPFQPTFTLKGRANMLFSHFRAQRGRSTLSARNTFARALRDIVFYEKPKQQVERMKKHMPSDNFRNIPSASDNFRNILFRYMWNDRHERPIF